MKIQDIVFFLILIFLLWHKKSLLITTAGLLCLLLSIALFAVWVFFTAQHLVWYAAGFFLATILFELWDLKKEKII